MFDWLSQLIEFGWDNLSFLYNKVVKEGIMKYNVLQIYHSTTVDGVGFRSSIYLAGCNHSCPGCHNQISWDFSGGEIMDERAILNELKQYELDNVTLTGGDPMYQWRKLLPLVDSIHNGLKKTIWVYTGFTWGELWSNTMLKSEEDRKAMMEFMSNVECIVDGGFEIDKKGEYKFKGSSNQRIIDVQRSLESGIVVEWVDPF